MTGGRKKGCYFVIGNLENSEQIFICEGYAIGATVHECINLPVVVAFDANGLKPVAKIIRAKYPNAKIVICADNDQYHENGANPGVEKAIEAAKEVNALVVMPEFRDTSTKPTDFNDLFVLEGAETVKAALENAATPDMPAGFHLTEDGLFCVSEKECKRISNYIKVLAFTKNNKKISKLVEFKDYKGRLLKTTLHSGMFSKGGDQVRIHLSDLGFVYAWNPLAKCKLVEYLSDSIPDREAIVVTHTGFFGNVYVRPDLVIGDTRDEIILDESIDDAAFSTRGTLSDWQNCVSKYCENNSRLIFAVSTAFASVLLRVCEIPNVGFHLVGNSSSGKLMLNMLLSFAQFERELTGERIRDKFASSLKKGMWMGGVVMLGYEVKDRKLIIKEDEAEIIRLIFKQFLASESCIEVVHLLNKLGHRTKIKKLKTGETSGGQMFERKAVERILKNQYYKGYVTHKGNAYPGEHEAIIDEETWEKVQEIFRKNATGQKRPCYLTPSFLKGIIYCSCGALMKHSCSGNHGLVYRYYTCLTHLKYRTCPAQHKNIPAEPVEQSVIDEIFKIIRSPEVVVNMNRLAEQRNDLKKEDLMLALKNLSEAWNYLYRAEQTKIVQMLVDSVEIRDDGIKLHLNLDGFDNLFVELTA
ncbi:MAG: DUF927 domain-containing protein [Holosporaceae bacterium]|nr:DUF927 domain-containing protein [Holosporaceae bacterium]